MPEHETTLTPTQEKALRAMAGGANFADEIAYRLGYRPARSGRLAVTSALRALLHRGTDQGALVGRIGPADRWGHARWFLTHEGTARVNG